MVIVVFRAREMAEAVFVDVGEAAAVNGGLAAPAAASGAGAAPPAAAVAGGAAAQEVVVKAKRSASATTTNDKDTVKKWKFGQIRASLELIYGLHKSATPKQVVAFEAHLQVNGTIVCNGCGKQMGAHKGQEGGA